MRIAVLSDIHSNVYALQAVIKDMNQRGFDIGVNLGDILYGSIAPKATYEVLMEQDFVTIRGNQDRQIYEADDNEIAANPIMQFILEDLGREPLEWMQSLEFDHQLNDEVYLCHGTPKDDLVYLLENVTSGFAQIREDQDILSLLAGQTSPLILCGHTHTPRAVRLSSDQLIVNPGSVGLPAYCDEEPVVHTMQTLSPHASYAILEKQASGWNIQHIRIAYDEQKAARESAKRGHKNWVHFLTTGRGL